MSDTPSVDSGISKVDIKGVPQKTPDSNKPTDSSRSSEAQELVEEANRGESAQDKLEIIAGNDDSHEDSEDIETKKLRIGNLWSEWNDIQNDQELIALFDRKTALPEGVDPVKLLESHGYPPRTRIDHLQFENWRANLDPKFFRDGFIYLLRGDHPNLEKKGFYSRPYGYAKKTTQQLAHDLQSSDEVGYFLYGNEAYLKTAEPSSSSIAQELAFKQSQIGGSSFVSATTSLESAIAGTGNNPDPQEQSQYEVYILRIPIDSVINSNTGNFFGMEESEYLIPDYVRPDEVVAKFPRDQREAIYQYMFGLLGISRGDLGRPAPSPQSSTKNPTV